LDFLGAIPACLQAGPAFHFIFLLFCHPELSRWAFLQNNKKDAVSIWANLSNLL
jgi:hypothetical protein